MITTKTYRGKFEPIQGFPIVFGTMPLAEEYCQGEGLEIGAAAHNPFGLEGAQNVAPKKRKQDWDYYRRVQAAMCGEYADVDIDAEADSERLAKMNVDYIIHSHVFEHLPNPLNAMKVWYQALKPGGVLFMIVPKRDALPKDAERPVTPLDDLVAWYKDKVTIDTFDWEAQGLNEMGHATVWTLDSLIEMVTWCNDELGHTWNIECTEETDSKVGNGHTIVLRKI